MCFVGSVVRSKALVWCLVAPSALHFIFLEELPAREAT